MFIVIMSLTFTMIFSHRTKPPVLDYFRFWSSNTSDKLQFLGILFFADVDKNLPWREFSADLLYLITELFSAKYTMYDKDTNHLIVE